MSEYQNKDFVIVDDGLLCMVSVCKVCEAGHRSKVIISYKPAYSIHNSLIKTKCISCMTEETIRISDVTEED